LSKLQDADDIKKQKALMREIQTKATNAEVAVVKGKTELANLLTKLTAAKTVLGTAETKFITVQKKWNDKLLAEKEKKRGDIKKRFEEGETAVTELTEKLAMYTK
jgi:hypothetical protein